MKKLRNFNKDWSKRNL